MFVGVQRYTNEVVLKLLEYYGENNNKDIEYKQHTFEDLGIQDVEFEEIRPEIDSSSSDDKSETSEDHH